MLTFPYGLDMMAPQDRIKQDIRNHGLGVTSKAKQVFNINNDDATISRSKEANKNQRFLETVSSLKEVHWDQKHGRSLPHVIITCSCFFS